MVECSELGSCHSVHVHVENGAHFKMKCLAEEACNDATITVVENTDSPTSIVELVCSGNEQQRHDFSIDYYPCDGVTVDARYAQSFNCSGNVCQNVEVMQEPTGCEEVFRNNANTDGEEYAGHVSSVEECVQLVQEKCEWANIANVDADELLTGEAADCWCQKGNDMTPADSSAYLNCWFGESSDTQSDVFECHGCRVDCNLEEGCTEDTVQCLIAAQADLNSAASISDRGIADGDTASIDSCDSSAPLFSFAVGICIGVIITVLAVMVMRKQKERKQQSKAVEVVHVPDESNADKNHCNGDGHGNVMAKEQAVCQ